MVLQINHHIESKISSRTTISIVLINSFYPIDILYKLQLYISIMDAISQNHSDLEE